MSFGTRGHRSRKYESQRTDRRPTTATFDVKSWGLFALVILLPVFLIAGGIVIYSSTINAAILENAGEVDTFTPSEFSGDLIVTVAAPDGSADVPELDYRLALRCLKNRPITVPRDGYDPRSRPRRFKIAYRDFQYFLVCASVVERNRLCKAFYRKRFAQRVLQYWTTRRDYLRLMRRASESPFTRRTATKSSGMSGREITAFVATAPEITTVPSGLARALQNLSEDGLLFATDFGWMGRNSIPRPMRAFVAERPSRSVC
ncbi:MAG: hypothetical protein AAFY27_00675 [Pseudomonadota bacterium]